MLKQSFNIKRSCSGPVRTWSVLEPARKQDKQGDVDAERSSEEKSDNCRNNSVRKPELIKREPGRRVVEVAQARGLEGGQDETGPVAIPSMT